MWSGSGRCGHLANELMLREQECEDRLELLRPAGGVAEGAPNGALRRCRGREERQPRRPRRKRRAAQGRVVPVRVVREKRQSRPCDFGLLPGPSGAPTEARDDLHHHPHISEALARPEQDFERRVKLECARHSPCFLLCVSRRGLGPPSEAEVNLVALPLVPEQGCDRRVQERDAQPQSDWRVAGPVI